MMRKKFFEARERVRNLLKRLAGKGAGNGGGNAGGTRRGVTRRLMGVVGVALALWALSGCATTVTTTDITFVHSDQPPEGKFKHVTVTTAGEQSVLQRFYAKYPSTKYQVVAYERVKTNHVKAARIIGGAVLGSFVCLPTILITSLIVPDEPLVGISIAAFGAILGSGGAWISGFYTFEYKYIVTYVEKGEG